MREPCVRVDERTVSDPALLRKGSQDWYKEGRNHRVENGRIRRDFDGEDWFIEINSLDELAAFSKLYGEIVIGQAWDREGYMRLEIYDTYRE